MTSLCTIPNCRIRGRHLTTCEDEKCVGCLPRLADDGYSCPRCASVAAQNLGTVAEVALAVSDAANRLSSGSGGGGSGKPGSRLPLDLGARSRLDAVEGSLYGWARHVSEERGVRLPGLPVPPKPQVGPVCRTRYECTHDSCKAIRDPASAPLLLAVVAGWLVGHLDWLAHRPEVDEAFSDFADCARALRGVAQGPSEQRYLGPCGAVATLTDGFDHEFEYEQPPCDGDVYARDGAQRGRCTTCGAEVGADERRAWLDGEVRERAFCRTDIEDAYGIKANTMTTWWLRGKLKAYWVTEAGLHVQWVELKPDPALKGNALARREAEIKAEHKVRGTKVFYLADVLDLAAGDAARREGDRATRARRTAARAAESETAA